MDNNMKTGDLPADHRTTKDKDKVSVDDTNRVSVGADADTLLTKDRIERRAYRIWLQRGSPTGEAAGHQQDWNRAIGELRGEITQGIFNPDGD